MRHLALRPDRAPAPEHDRLSGKPARPDDIAARPGQPGPRAAAMSSSRDPSVGSNHGRAAVPALLPIARKDGKDGDCIRSLCAYFVSFVRLVVWSVVAGYNYQLIVIANRRCCFSNPAPGKFPSPKAGTTWLSGPTRCGQEHKTNQVRHFSKHCSFSSLPHLFKCAVPNIRRISDIEIERRSNESICGSERENIAFAQAIR